MITFLKENILLFLGKLVAELTLKKVFIFKLKCPCKSLRSPSPPPPSPQVATPAAQLTAPGFSPSAGEGRCSGGIILVANQQTKQQAMSQAEKLPIGSEELIFNRQPHQKHSLLLSSRLVSRLMSLHST